MKWAEPGAEERREALNRRLFGRPDLKIVTIRNGFGELERIVAEREKGEC